MNKNAYRYEIIENNEGMFDNYVDIVYILTMENSKIIENCYTCFPSVSANGKNIIKCVNSMDSEKVVRTYMHPYDDIQETLWIFQAKIKCFSRFHIIKKIEETQLLKNYSDNVITFTEIQYENMT